MALDKDDFIQLGYAVATFAASFIVKKALEKGYKKVYKVNPPDKREEEPSWVDLIGWTVLTGLAASATKTWIRRQEYGNN